MGKKYNYVVNISVEAICKTPFRIGNSENDTETVLKYMDGTPFIAGTSITGVFKNYLNSVGYNKQCKNIFGDRNIESKVVVSDGVFEKYNEVLRPRVCIDYDTGATIKGGKFDIAHIETGSKFSFDLTWLGMKEDLFEVDFIYNILLSLDKGDITFGGQKTNGFGKVSIKVFEQKFDLSVKNDLESWLKNKDNKTLLDLNKIEKNITEKNKLSHTKFKITGKADNILVKSSNNELINTVTYAVNMKESGEYIIPASSIKGAIRSRAFAICEKMTGDLLETENIINYIFGGKDKDNKAIAGNIIFEDIILKDTKTVKVTRIRVNKFTGGVIGSALFSEIPISGEFEFLIKISKIKNKEIDNEKMNVMARKLLTLVLRDLSAGIFTIGGGKSVGRGELSIYKIDINDFENLDNQKTAVIKLDNDKKISLEDKNNLVADWLGGK